MSTLPAAELPANLNHPGAQRLCKVESALPSDMKAKNRRWYNTGSQYRRAEFDVQVLVGAADLKFRTLGKDGILSQTHDTIDVEWYSGLKVDRQTQPAFCELGDEGLDRAGPYSSRSKPVARASEFLMRRFHNRS